MLGIQFICSSTLWLLPSLQVITGNPGKRWKMLHLSSPVSFSLNIYGRTGLTFRPLFISNILAELSTILYMHLTLKCIIRLILIFVFNSDWKIYSIKGQYQNSCLFYLISNFSKHAFCLFLIFKQCFNLPGSYCFPFFSWI